MSASLHQIARGGVVEEGEDFFREVTDSRGEQAANAVDGMQRTPLHLACWAGKAGMIGLLLRHRADCMAGAQDGFTPLHFCSQAGCAEGCRLLLAAGAKVDAKLLKTRKAVRVLMQAGADVSSETSKGQTPMHLASKHPEVRAALAGESPPTPTPVPVPVPASPVSSAASATATATATASVSAEAAGEEAPAAEVAVAAEAPHGTKGSGKKSAPSAGARVVGSGAEKKANEPAEKEDGQGTGAKGDASAPAVVRGGGVERAGSLAERRRKKRKLAKAAAGAGAAGGKGVGVSLSHLDGEGGDGDDVV